MAADPFAMAVTNPVALTVATLESDDAQVKALPGIALPLASRALAISRTVSLTETSVSAGAVTTTEATLGGVGLAR